MKKIVTIALALLMALCLAGCSKNSAKKGVELYGEWEIVKIEDPSGEISQDILDAMLPSLKEQGYLFSLSIAEEESFMNSYDERYRIKMDLENGIIKDLDYGQDITFEYKNKQIRITEAESGYVFILEKVN